MWSAYLLISVVRFLMIVCINININFVQNFKVLTTSWPDDDDANAIKGYEDHTLILPILRGGRSAYEFR